ncbi:MAG: Gfo/Idh/MocA family oxidoreductase [Candidatus Marinimicrobia bacterium]|nr:Gfo/Idh/MocA family oxidoreductase [Candidatus Neomarinimicrobiota bacterium]
MKALRIGIIGTGGRGVLGDSYLTPEDQVKIVAGADISAQQLERFQARVKAKQGDPPNGYLDYREMIAKEQLDGVFVTSPDFCHEEQAVFVLEHGIGVYLEKPIAISMAGADRILEAAYKHRSKLVLGHNMRYMSFVLKMKALVDSGAIGEVKAIWCRHFIGYGGDAYFRDWHADRRYANSLLLQKGAHDIDVIHWLAGSFTKRVNGLGTLAVYDQLPRRSQDAQTPVDVTFNVNHWPPMEQKDFNPVIDVEDLSMINMQLANGVQASYMQCHFTPDDCRNYTIIGTRGRIENYGDHQEGATIELWDDRKGGFRLHGDATFRTSPGQGGHGGSDPAIVRSFFAALRGQGTPNSTPQAARYSVATGCLGADSIRSGGLPFAVPALPDYLENHPFHK